MPLFTWTQTELARKLAPPKRPCQLASRRALFAACPLPSRVASTSPAGLAPPAPFFAKITSPAPTPLSLREIGRASCRERGEGAVAAVPGKYKQYRVEKN